MKFFGEFKEFIARGNVMDMAVGVVIGAAFKAIIDSLVNDIISPVIGAITKSVDLSALAVTVPETDIVIKYGSFISAIINFLIVAFVIFCAVKSVNTLKARADALIGKEKAEEEAPEPEPTKEEILLTEIRDLLKDKQN